MFLHLRIECDGYSDPIDQDMSSYHDNIVLYSLITIRSI